MTFRHFKSQKGRPAEVFCENRRNFVAGAEEFDQFYRLTQLHYQISEAHTEYHYLSLIIILK